MRLCFAAICLVSTAVSFEGEVLASPRQQEACVLFHRMLDSVAHETLSLASGAHVSRYDGGTYAGCEVLFETNDLVRAGGRVPDLSAVDGTDLYLSGWRIDDTVAADGPGTSLFSIRKESTWCLVSEAQPAYLDDSGEIVSSDTLNIVIQCRLE